MKSETSLYLSLHRKIFWSMQIQTVNVEWEETLYDRLGSINRLSQYVSMVETMCCLIFVYGRIKYRQKWYFFKSNMICPKWNFCEEEWSILIMRNWPKNIINIILGNHYAKDKEKSSILKYTKRGSRGAARAAKSLRWSV